MCSTFPIGGREGIWGSTHLCSLILQILPTGVMSYRLLAIHIKECSPCHSTWVNSPPPSPLPPHYWVVLSCAIEWRRVSTSSLTSPWFSWFSRFWIRSFCLLSNYMAWGHWKAHNFTSNQNHSCNKCNELLIRVHCGIMYTWILRHLCWHLRHLGWELNVRN